MIGVILGQAFDRAVTIVLDKWIVFLGASLMFAALHLLANLSSPLLRALIGLGWLPISATLAIRAFRPAFRPGAGDVARLFMAIIGWSALTFVPCSILVTEPIRNYLHARQVGENSMTSSFIVITAIAVVVIYTLWMGAKLSLAPTLTFAEHHSIDAAFKRSWRLTEGRFWPVLGFNALIALAQLALTTIPIAATAALLPASSAYLGSHVVPALFSPLVLYATLASWCGFVRLVDWLERFEHRPAAA